MLAAMISSPSIPRIVALLAFFWASGCKTTGGVERLRNPELCQAGKLVEVAWPQRLYPAVALTDLDSSGMCLVEYDTDERTWTERVATDRVFGAAGGSGASICRAGERVLVDWAGAQWHAALVRGGIDEEGRCPVHYTDYEDAFDEAVELERLRADND